MATHIEILRKGLFLYCGESPNWDERTQKLYCVDASQNYPHKNRVLVIKDNQSDSSDQLYTFSEDNSITTFCIPTSDPDKLVISHRQQVALLDLTLHDESSSRATSVCSVESGRMTRFNDGKCDANGRLLAGTMSMETDVPTVMYEENAGALYSFDGCFSSKQYQLDTPRMLDTGISLSNGIEWSLDNRKLFFVDSLARKIFCYDYDLATGMAGNKRTFLELTDEKDGYPDGIAIDTQNHLWIACFAGGQILIVDAETAKLVHTIKFPYKFVTSCCFGGSRFESVFVTSNVSGVSDADIAAGQGTAGSLFKLSDLPGNVKGKPMNKFDLA